MCQFFITFAFGLAPWLLIGTSKYVQYNQESWILAIPIFSFLSLKFWFESVLILCQKEVVEVFVSESLSFEKEGKSEEEGSFSS